MLQVIDPSVADERDPFSVVPELDMYDPDNGWRPWPEPCRYDREWLARTAPRSVARVARIDAIAPRRSSPTRGARARRCATLERGDARVAPLARAAPCTREYMTIYRTLADPAYLDPTIDPDDRPLGSLFAFPDPFDANYGRGGLARTMTRAAGCRRGRGCRRRRSSPTRCRTSTCPTLVVHADRRHRDPRAPGPRDPRPRPAATTSPTRRSRARRTTSRAPPREAMELVAEWIRARFP